MRAQLFAALPALAAAAAYSVHPQPVPPGLCGDSGDQEAGFIVSPGGAASFFWFAPAAPSVVKAASAATGGVPLVLWLSGVDGPTRSRASCSSLLSMLTFNRQHQ